jgi:organic hydroperoxide reductase OsmC/OhrA
MATAPQRAFRFPVDAHWSDGRVTRVAAPGKRPLAVATPAQFHDGVEGLWSPEDLLVASVATCYALTLVGIAEHRGVPLKALEVCGEGEVDRRVDGRFAFTALRLAVQFQTTSGREDEARLAAKDAERSCLVSASLDARFHVDLDLRSAPAIA